MELGELRCEYCEETITSLELYECVNLNLGNRMHYNHEILTFKYRNALWTSQRLPDGSKERYYHVGHAGRARDSIETERARS